VKTEGLRLPKGFYSDSGTLTFFMPFFEYCFSCLHDNKHSYGNHHQRKKTMLKKLHFLQYGV